MTKANRDQEGAVEDWEHESILNHRWSRDKKRKGKIDVQTKWVGYDQPTWEPVEVIMIDDPVTLAKYAQDKKIEHQAAWKWTQRYL